MLEGLQKIVAKREALEAERNMEKLVVDPNNGPYYNIKEAVKAAKPYSKILVEKGLYTDNLVIDKPGLIITPKSKESNIIMVVNGGPAIVIDIPNDGKCDIVDVKIAHTAISEDDESRKDSKAKEQEKMLDKLFSQNNKAVEFQKDDPKGALAVNLQLEDTMNCLVYVKRGKIILKVNFYFLLKKFYIKKFCIKFFIIFLY